MSAQSPAFPVAPVAPVIEKEDRSFYATQWQLIWWKFRKHKLAVISSVLLILLYLSAIFASFVAPYNPVTRFDGQQQQPAGKR